MRAALAIAVLLFAPGMWGQRQVEYTPIKWQPITAADGRAITGVRWVNGANGPLLVVSSQRSGPGPMDSAVVFAGGAELTAIRTVRQSLPSQPDWDVRSGAETLLAYTDAAGAVNGLMLDNGRDARVVSTGTPFESFQRPRFVKHASSELLVAIEGDKRAVLFPTPGRQTEYETLPDCDSALVLAVADAFRLVYKTTQPGPPRANIISPGALHLAELDGRFGVRGRIADLLPGVAVFEYDADLARGELALIATTPAGTTLTIGQVTRPFDEALPQAMSSPSVLAAGDRLRLAAVERAGAPNARVLTAEFPIQ